MIRFIKYIINNVNKYKIAKINGYEFGNERW